MTYLLDTDHITLLQRATGREYARLQARIAQYPLAELAFPIISLHEQVMGCHAYINQARTTDDLVRGYAMLGTVVWLKYCVASRGLSIITLSLIHI